MCLIFFSYEVNTDYHLILAANRDEFYDRPTSHLDFWEDTPYILAGRDLKNNGTWMGITQTGRFAAITNFREFPVSLSQNINQPPSRGLLISNFLAGTESPDIYLENIKKTGNSYNGFNLLVGDSSGLFYYSNRIDDVQKIKPGLYGLSNHILDTPWPKVEKGKAEFKVLAEKLRSCSDMEQEEIIEDIFSMLGDRSYPPEDRLPDTGIGITWEKILSPLCVRSEIYGTRSSSILLVEWDGKTTFLERTFIPKQGGTVEHKTRKFTIENHQSHV
ncbi:MAG: NRDE family protein [Desulfobacterales bacterium]|nr:NRDE family protein [Desulfobacterales bacterium]